MPRELSGIVRKKSDPNSYTMSADFKIVSGRCTYDLAEKIADKCGLMLSEVSVIQFSDGEIQPVYEESVCSSDVYIIQSTHSPSDNFHELLMLIDAAKRDSASSVVAIIPYFGYSRHVYLDRPGVPLTAKLHAKLLHAAGINMVITLDLYSDKVESFFDVPICHLQSTKLFASFIMTLELDHIAFGATAASGAIRAERFAKLFHTNYVVCHKHKPKSHTIDNKQIIGNVTGQNIILIDSIIDTGGSICSAARIIMDKGALSVRAFVTHPVLSGDAYEKIANSDLDELIVTDTIPLKKASPKIRVLSTADLFAEAIYYLKVKNPIPTSLNFDN